MMSPVAIVLMLACAASGQYLYGGYYGIPSWTVNSAALPVSTVKSSAIPYAYNALPYTFSPYAYAPAPLVTKSQYHSQDELGQASFGYSHPGQAAANFRDAFGNQVGSYAYINPDGKEVKVSYVADSLGFRVLSNDLPVAPVADLVAPVPVEDTVEVAEAKAAHMKAIEDAKAGIVAPLPVAEEVELPKPVEDTDEVKEAKAEHAAAVIAAKALADASPERRKRQAVLPLPLLRAPLAYNVAVAAPAVVAPAIATRDATLTQVVNNPGHAISYRVD